MKQSSGNKKSNLLILAIVGAIIIIFAVLCLVASGQEAEPSGGWKGQTREEAQEELDNMGAIGGVLLVVGIGIEAFAFVKNQSNSKLSTEESETIDRYEKRLKELNNELKENKITNEEYTNKKSKILNNIVSEVNTLDLLKKRLREMTIDDLVTEEEVKNIIENINTDNKKTKNKRTATICIIIIVLFVVGTIIGIISSSNSSSKRNFDLSSRMTNINN